jgi:hypothetical protein
MKRGAVGFAGFAYGMFLTWLCLYVVSQMGWSGRHNCASGCCELGHCPLPWWAAAAIFGYLFGLPILLGLLNAFAWGRWPVRRWVWYFVSLTSLTVVLHLAAPII